jgi:hypothetical protein
VNLCRHCGKCKITRPRGLCWGCHKNPAIRDLYPDGSHPNRLKGEPTDAELDAMIAEQRATMPEERYRG